MKVVFLNPIAELGGAERSLLDLLWSLRATEPDLQLEVLAFQPGPLLAAVAALGVAARVVEMPDAQTRLGDSGLGLRTLTDLGRGLAAAPGFAHFLHRLRNEIRASSPDILHSNGLKAHLLGAWVRPSGVPLVWHLRDFLSTRPVMRRILPRFESRAAAAIGISEAVSSDARIVLRKVPVQTVLNAVRTHDFADLAVEPADLDRLAGLESSPSSTVRIGMLATHASWKGHALFLEVARRVSGRRVRFYLVGGPLYVTSGSQTETASLQASVTGAALGGSCGLIPFQQDPRPIYRALDVVVSASTRPEPFGRTVAEAMAAGRTVVAPDSGGIPEQIADGVTGRLYRPGDAAALAGILTELVASPQDRARLGEAAARHAAVQLDARRLGRQVLEVYRGVVRASVTDASARETRSAGRRR